MLHHSSWKHWRPLRDHTPQVMSMCMIVKSLRALRQPGCRLLSMEGNAAAAATIAQWDAAKTKHFPSGEALNTWMTNYHAADGGQQHGERVVGALMSMLEQRLLAGPNSMAGGVLWSRVLAPTQAEDCTMLFQDLVAVCNGGAVTAAEEQCDTFIRALFWKNDAHVDAFLADYAAACLDDFVSAAGRNDNDPMWQLRFDTIANMFPSDSAERDRLRVPVHKWSIPALDIHTFKSDILTNENVLPYAYTAFHQFRVWDLRQLAKSDPQEFSQGVLPAAGALTGAILDALWAAVYASGDVDALERVAAVAGYGLLELQRVTGGPQQMKRAIKALITSRDPAHAISKICPHYGPERVIISAGVSACYSILQNSFNTEGLVAAHLDYLHQELNGKAESPDSVAMLELCNLLQVLRAADDISKVMKSKFEDNN